MTQITDVARGAGKAALIRVYDQSHEAGKSASEELPNATFLHQSLAKAKNVDQLVGVVIGVMSAFETYYREYDNYPTERALMVKAIRAYTNAVSTVLGVPVPVEGLER